MSLKIGNTEYNIVYSQDVLAWFSVANPSRHHVWVVRDDFDDPPAYKMTQEILTNMPNVNSVLLFSKKDGSIVKFIQSTGPFVFTPALYVCADALIRSEIHVSASTSSIVKDAREHIEYLHAYGLISETDIRLNPAHGKYLELSGALTRMFHGS